VKIKRTKWNLQINIGNWLFTWLYGDRVVLFNSKTYVRFCRVFNRTRPNDTLGDMINDVYINNHGNECGCEVCMGDFEDIIDNSMK
jgi:hypothetical protein